MTVFRWLKTQDPGDFGDVNRSSAFTVVCESRAPEKRHPTYRFLGRPGRRTGWRLIQASIAERLHILPADNSASAGGKSATVFTILLTR